MPLCFDSLLISDPLPRPFRLRNELVTDPIAASDESVVCSDESDVSIVQSEDVFVAYLSDLVTIVCGFVCDSDTERTKATCATLY